MFFKNVFEFTVIAVADHTIELDKELMLAHVLSLSQNKCTKTTDNIPAIKKSQLIVHKIGQLDN